MPAKSSVTLRRELGRVKDQLRRDDLERAERAEMYGAQQALSWALGNDAEAPSKLPMPPKAK